MRGVAGRVDMHSHAAGTDAGSKQIAPAISGYGQDTCKKVSQGHEGYLGSDALDDRPHHRTADTTY